VAFQPSEATAILPSLPAIYDEPFADSSNSKIPTYLVSRLAREKLTVALSGDGGDELWAGYNRHLRGGRLWEATRRIPVPARRAAGAALTRVAPQHWDTLFTRAGPARPSRLGVRTPGVKVHKLVSVLPVDSPAALYQTLVSHWPDPGTLVPGADDRDPLTERTLPGGVTGLAAQMMHLDQVGYLPDDILVKLDRAAMAVTLETRVPMLDHRAVELAWQVPTTVKLQGAGGKWPLRQVLARYVPAELVEQAKMGFGVPLGEWLRTDLRPWAEDLRADGYLDPGPVPSGPVRSA